MTIMWDALRPNSEAPSRPWPVELGTAIFDNSNAATDTFLTPDLQPGRIVATHWLRPDIGDAA